MNMDKEKAAMAQADKAVVIEQDGEKEGLEMKRELGYMEAISIVIGTIIGSGIFVSPKGVLRATGSVGLCLTVWVLAGVFQLGAALCYAELGTLLPKSGGSYTYIKTGLGNVPATVFMFQTILVNAPASMVVIWMTTAKYILSMLPTCGSPDTLQKFIAAAIMITQFLFNAYSSRLSASIAIVTAVAKVGVLVVICVGGIVSMAQGSIKDLDTGFEDTETNPTTLALALYSANFAYSGAAALNGAVENIKNPSKTLPRALISGLLLVIVIYMLTNISYLAVMTRAEMLAAPAVATLWAERTIGVFAPLMPIAVIVSTMGAVNNHLYTGARMFFAVARDKNMPEIFSYIQMDRLTPVPALTFTITLALIYLVPAEPQMFINYMGFISSFYNILIYVCFFIFRYKTMKDVHRPIKVPIVIPAFMLLLQTYLFLGPLVINPKLDYVYVAAGVFGGTGLMYLLFIKANIDWPGYTGFIHFVQLVLRVAPPAQYEAQHVAPPPKYDEKHND